MSKKDTFQKLKKCTFLLAGAALLLAQSACFEMSETGCEGGDALDFKACHQEGIIIDNTCAHGLWGGKWIQLTDGQILQPFSANENLSLPTHIQAGTRVRIDFEETYRDARYDSAITCLAIPPFQADKVVKINCFEMVTK